MLWHAIHQKIMNFLVTINSFNLKGVFYMENIRTYFLSATTGKSETGTYYRVTIGISEKIGESERDFACDFYVNVDTYAKAKGFKKFQDVDCIFMPTSAGRARLVSIEGL